MVRKVDEDFYGSKMIYIENIKQKQVLRPLVESLICYCKDFAEEEGVGEENLNEAIEGLEKFLDKTIKLHNNQEEFPVTLNEEYLMNFDFNTSEISNDGQNGRGGILLREDDDGAISEDVSNDPNYSNLIAQYFTVYNSNPQLPPFAQSRFNDHGNSRGSNGRSI